MKLKSRLKVEPLTANDCNRLAIQQFVADTQGINLERYLKERAWEEDINGGTKIFLVKDIETEVIVFFFALSAGLLYKSIDDDEHNLTEKEREIVELCIAYRLDPNNGYTEEDVFEWYADEPFDNDRLRKIIEEKATIKLNAKSDQNRTEETSNIMRVLKTFPGIVLTHFCKSKYSPFSEELSFSLGFYVFWEIITEKVLDIAERLGCQYLYLFAADSSDITNTTLGTISSNDYFYDDIDESNKTAPVYKLVEYYKTELKFEEVQGMIILKPFYDFECFSLIQPINMLLDNKNAAWIQHSDIEN